MNIDVSKLCKQYLDRLFLWIVDRMSEEEFFLFCAANPELQIERNKYGQILIVSPTGSETGFYDLSLGSVILQWNKKKKTGITFGSSAGFTLPDGSVKSADVAWIVNSRWEEVSMDDRKRFAHICPDFVAEIKSPSGSWKELQEKMNQWVENGCQLGWLIDPVSETVEIYQPGRVQKGDWLNLHGDTTLPGLALNLKEVFEA